MAIGEDPNLYKAHGQLGREGQTAHDRQAQRENRAFAESPEGQKIAAIEARLAKLEETAFTTHGQGLRSDGNMVSLQDSSPAGGVTTGLQTLHICIAGVPFSIKVNGEPPVPA